MATATHHKIEDLRIVLALRTDPDEPPEYTFVELEDQDGRGVAAFKIKPCPTSSALSEIVIPYDVGGKLMEAAALLRGCQGQVVDPDLRRRIRAFFGEAS